MMQKRVAISPGTMRTVAELKAYYNGLPPVVSPITLDEVDEVHGRLGCISRTRLVMLTQEEVRQLRTSVEGDPTLSDYAKSLKRLEEYLSKSQLIIGDTTHQKETRTYKQCGAYYATLKVKERDPSATIITASAGNHAAGIAWSAEKENMNVTIVVPTCTPVVKIQNIKRLLGIPEDQNEVVIDGKKRTLRIEGADFDVANAIAIAEGKKPGYAFISPYNDRDVWLGQTYNLSSMKSDLEKMGVPVESIDTMVVPVGGGGFASGVGSYAKLLNPNMHIVGVEPQTHAKFSSATPPQSHEDTLQNPGKTRGDGTATKKYGDLTYRQLLRTVDRFHAVSEGAIEHAIAVLYLAKEIVAEGAGALALALIMSATETVVPAGTTLAIVSGGNINPSDHEKIVQTHSLQASLHRVTCMHQEIGNSRQ